MRYSSLGYSISEGFSNVFKNKKSTAISIVTMICAMFLFGIFFAIGENINTVLEQVQKQQGIKVFLFDFTTEEQKTEMEKELKALDGVNTVTYKTKEQALESFRESMKDYKDATEGMDSENNIFPASFEVTLTDLEKNEEIQKKAEELGRKLLPEDSVTEEIKTVLGESEIEKPTIVKNIESSDYTIEALLKIARAVRITIAVIFVILLVIAITIISNTIKLTVHARRKEISIMKYVGATNSFIRWPFIVEGIIIGVIAAFVTLVIVGFAYDFVIQEIESSVVLQKMNITLLQFADLVQSITIVYAVLGIGVGVIGSSISMKKYLEV